MDNYHGITWRGESIDDVEILPDLPAELFELLTRINGFILHLGALHVRGASQLPGWHSLRAAWRGPQAFHVLYEEVRPSDVPFAQDQFGDQFLLREGVVFRLKAETGEVEPFATHLQDFLGGVSRDIEGYLNVGLAHSMEPGQLLHASPPFCFKESGASASLKALSARGVIDFHAELARQIRDFPDGEKVTFRVVDG